LYAGWPFPRFASHRTTSSFAERSLNKLPSSFVKVRNSLGPSLLDTISFYRRNNNPLQYGNDSAEAIIVEGQRKKISTTARNETMNIKNTSMPLSASV